MSDLHWVGWPRPALKPDITLAGDLKLGITTDHGHLRGVARFARSELPCDVPALSGEPIGLLFGYDLKVTHGQ